MTKCEFCGYLNPDLNRFCGKCGHALEPVPVPVRAGREAGETQPTRVSISGPSFLGLESEDGERDSVGYLLEEDEPRSHRGGIVLLFVVILLFLAAAGFVLYEKYYFVPAASLYAPASSAPAFAYEKTSADTLAQLQNAALSPEAAMPSRSLADRLAMENFPAEMKKLAAADASSQAGAQLLTAGEKYLHGRGVVTNCKLAVQNFERAADQGNASAMAHLGTMYGSGRCVKFDRVKAYQWFARSRNTDPSNPWLESSMDMLWRNMTAKERAAILK